MSIAAINSAQYGSSMSMQATSSVPASGTAASSSTTSSTTASSTAVSSDLGSWLMSMGIGDDPAVQLMAALLTLAILQELLGEQSKNSDSENLLASLGQVGLFFASSSFHSSSTISSSSTYSGQGAAKVGGGLDVTAGADTAVTDGGGSEPTIEQPVLDLVA